MKDDYISKIIGTFNFPCQNPEIRTIDISKVLFMIKHNPSLMKVFIDKMNDINIVIKKENLKNQHYIINCLFLRLKKTKKY